MTDDSRPVLVAFDASPEAQEALREAVELFPGRTVLVVSVWEPGLPMALTSIPDTAGMAYVAPTPEQIEAVDRAEREHATSAAEAGAQFVRELGAQAEAVPVAEGLDIPATLIAVADERDAAAIVVGTRGLGRVKAALLGSTSRKLLHESRRPVVVARAGE